MTDDERVERACIRAEAGCASASEHQLIARHQHDDTSPRRESPVKLPPVVPRPHSAPSWESLTSIAMSDRRDAIRRYARLGLHPIALHGIDSAGQCTCNRSSCTAPGKHPVMRAWQRAAFDLEALDEMLITNWRFNVGLRTGLQPCGRFLVVIDVDGPRSLLEPLEREHGRCPPTLTARTGRGGLHLYYWVRAGVELPNRAGVVPGVDVRGAGGQVVAPPSVHASGGRYEWRDARSPEVLP